MKSQRRIRKVRVYRLRIPLRTPYKLSLGEVESYDAFLVWTSVGDAEGVGETTPLPGYSGETVDTVSRTLEQWSRILIATDPSEALSRLKPLQRSHPFSATALVTAIEAALDPLDISKELQIPLLGTVMSHSEEEVENEINCLLRQNYTTLKVKVGWDEQEDAARVRHLQQILRDRATIRLDANQAYDLEQAVYVATHVDPGNIELFEQPFRADDWESMVRLSRVSPLPLMLDESIASEAALERMIRLQCAQVVKFKLMKAGGLDKLERLILRAREAGLKVVLGNGVAGDVGNFHELAVAGQHLETAGEMNGFLKQQERLLSNPYSVSGGKVTLPQGYAPRIDWDKVEACAAQSATVRSF